MKWNRCVSYCLFLSVLASGTAMGRTKLPMEAHMAIQKGEIEIDQQLTALPTVRIDTITANVSLEDRQDANKTFDKAFPEALKSGLTWYLAQRGVRVVKEDEQIRVTANVEHYQGFAWGGDWGADMSVGIRLRATSGLPLRARETSLRSFFKYRTEGKGKAEEKPKYEARGMKVSFEEILFTRIGVDLGEKLIFFLEDTSSAQGSVSP